MAQAMDADMQMVIDGYTPSGLTARQFGQRSRRLREQQPVQRGLAREPHVSESGPQRVVQSRVSHIPKGLQTPPHDLPRHDCGPRNIVCPECGALHWKGEMLRSSTLVRPRFGTCCGEGDKILRRIGNPPEPLYRLLTSSEPEAVQFRKHIRQYNAAFAFTSLGVQMDEK